MKERPKNIIALFVICLILIPTFIYGGTLQMGNNQVATTEQKVLKCIVVSPSEVELPIGASEDTLRELITVKAYHKGEKQPQIVTNYLTDYKTSKDVGARKSVTISLTEQGCTKKTKVCVTFCEIKVQKPKPIKPEVPQDNVGGGTTEINFPYISGYPDNTFRPNQPVTREEFATMIARLISRNDIPKQANKYSDLSDSRYSTDGINLVTRLDIFKPAREGVFDPFGTVSIADAREIVGKLAPYVKSVDVTFPSGNGNLTREQAVVLLNKLFDIRCDNTKGTSDFTDVSPQTPNYKDIICATQKRVTPR